MAKLDGIVLVEDGKAEEEFMLDCMGDDDNAASRSARERRSRTVTYRRTL